MYAFFHIMYAFFIKYFILCTMPIINCIEYIYQYMTGLPPCYDHYDQEGGVRNRQCFQDEIGNLKAQIDIYLQFNEEVRELFELGRRIRRTQLLEGRCTLRWSCGRQRCRTNSTPKQVFFQSICVSVLCLRLAQTYGLRSSHSLHFFNFTFATFFATFSATSFSATYFATSYFATYFCYVFCILIIARVLLFFYKYLQF